MTESPDGFFLYLYASDIEEMRRFYSDVTVFSKHPRWVGYWSFPVKDPMGHTVEVTHAPIDPPDEASWGARDN